MSLAGSLLVIVLSRGHATCFGLVCAAGRDPFQSDVRDQPERAEGQALLRSGGRQAFSQAEVFEAAREGKDRGAGDHGWSSRLKGSLSDAPSTIRRSGQQPAAPMEAYATSGTDQDHRSRPPPPPRKRVLANRLCGVVAI